MNLHKSIGYTSDWYHTLLLSLMLATTIVVVLIFLQPFDIYTNQIEYKNIKLVGYGICIILPVLLIHIFEEFWYRLTFGKWHIYQELVILVSGFLLISSTAYFYNVLVVNDLNIKLNHMLQWFTNFGLPFAPIFIPFWVYLRLRFSKIIIQPDIDKNEKTISIEGYNQNEVVEFLEKDFLMARAQSNYVDIYYIRNELPKKEIIRSKFVDIKNKILSAEQVHRSYLVNPLQINQIYGNTRKGYIKITKLEEEVPVSPKYFLGIKKYLQNQS
ncbi:LytTR family transcriptional regulator [Psychroflexus sp. YR1-1]|uniref:LytTR family transcriptional regulator n=1 Tax=Psychroflexus aurantiacus TaxID=2709310 RepID=A0A6B3R1Y5_9FLAO|nr:LytTR family DNA-binding domain-containing protein [Psychroflexus aurantiacus]NEV94639.1 LytTR family transcriptional regulator [Psychroflexus aurantiacus]